MTKPHIFAHTSYIGNTGYNAHSRSFFRHLSKLAKVKIRNFTVGNTWNELNDEPHNNESYINNVDKKLLKIQTLWNGKDLIDQPIYTNPINNFKHNVNIILQETNHHYYYDDYSGPKIGYNVWESTKQPEDFFNKWLEFDQLWVPTKWQANNTIKQGASPNKVKVIPEGVDINTFYPNDNIQHKDYDGRFKFVLFGRWEYRKSTTEIIKTFLSTFDPSEPVDLILSVDNIFGKDLDGCNTTEERIKKYNIPNDPRLKFKSFVSREDYIKYLKKGHIFLSCARSEGWNLPLIEAMACGTPSIYSNCSGQLEFAKDKGLPVKIKKEIPAPKSIPGNYYEPDFDDLSLVMRDAYKNYKKHKKRAIKDAKLIHKNYNWDKVAEIANNELTTFLNNYQEKNELIINFTNGPFVEIKGNEKNNYFVEFINGDTNELIFSDTISNNMWTKCNKEYYIPWVIKINGEIVHKLNLENQVVYIAIDSKSIGDTLAWVPQAVKFKNKYNCKLVLSTFHNYWFENLKEYKDIKFINPGSSFVCYAHYKVGWFSNEGKWDNGNLNPTLPQTVPLIKSASDILGLDFEEINYGVDFTPGERPLKNKYICIGPQATAACKEWTHKNWKQLSKKLYSKGYNIVALSKNGFKGINIIDRHNLPWNELFNYLYHADLFIGLGSGLSWINWALNKHTLMINNFTEPDHEFTKNITKLQNFNVCNSCWNKKEFQFDAGDWNWCPINKGTELQHICQKSITPDRVLEEALRLLT